MPGTDWNWTGGFHSPTPAIKTKGLTNAIKIKKGKEMSIFRTERPEDKRALLIAFKKVAEELMDKKRKDNLYEAERRNSSVSEPFIFPL